MTALGYRRLRLLKWFGAVFFTLLVIGIWLQLVPAWFAMASFILIGFPVALAAWILRDVTPEEFTNG